MKLNHNGFKSLPMIIGKPDPSIIYKNKIFESNICIVANEDLYNLEIEEILPNNFTALEKYQNFSKSNDTNNIKFNSNSEPGLKYLPKGTAITISYPIQNNISFDFGKYNISEDVFEAILEIFNLEPKDKKRKGKFKKNLRSSTPEDILQKRFPEENIVNNIMNSIETRVTYNLKGESKRFKSKIITNYTLGFPFIIPIMELSTSNENYQILVFQNIGHVDAYDVQFNIDIINYAETVNGNFTIVMHDKHGKPFTISYYIPPTDIGQYVQKKGSTNEVLKEMDAGPVYELLIPLT